MSNISFDPYKTTNGLGSFSIQSDGYVQGVAMDDPVTRYRLAGGVLGAAETLPIGGGVGISETTSPVSGGPATGLTGGTITRATNLTAYAAGTLTGFSVFDQNYSAINTPTSPVPLIGSGGQVNFYRLGSLARIPVAMDPSLVNTEGKVITQNVSWDFVNQVLVPYLGTLTISSGTYNNSTGVVTLTMSAPITFSPGDAVVVSSLTGTGAYASLNGTFTALAGTAGSTVVYNAGAGLGASTITGGSLTLGSGASVILPVKLLNVNVGNSMVVAYNSTTKLATWNRSGSCALIQI
jgi:hypothetical protein